MESYTDINFNPGMLYINSNLLQHTHVKLGYLDHSDILFFLRGPRVYVSLSVYFSVVLLWVDFWFLSPKSPLG